MENTEKTSLRSGALGTLTAAVIGAGMMGLAATEYIIFGPLTALLGKPVPLIFLLGIIITIPTAISYAMMMRVRPSTGSTFAWVSKAFSPKFGLFAGWCILAFYTINAWVMPAQIGLFFSSLLSYFGVHASFATFVAGAVFSVVIAGLIVYPGVSISGKTTLTFAAIEVGIMFALAGTVIAVHGPQMNMKPLDPHFITGGSTIVFQAMILMVLTFVGWDVTSTVAEETTERAKKRLPYALVATVVIVGLIWAVASYIFSFSAPTTEIVQLSKSGLTPMGTISEHYWGGGSLFVDITALTGSIATFIGAIIGSSRIAYALGREGFMPKAFGRLHPNYLTPWNALHFILASSLVVTLVVAAMIGSMNSYVWIGSNIVFFALLTYFFTNLSNIVYYHRFERQKRNVVTNLIVPIVGSIFSIGALYFGFFVADWNAGFKTGQSIVLFALLVTVVGIVYTLVMVKRKPHLLTNTDLSA